MRAIRVHGHRSRQRARSERQPLKGIILDVIDRVTYGHKLGRAPYIIARIGIIHDIGIAAHDDLYHRPSPTTGVAVFTFDQTAAKVPI